MGRHGAYLPICPPRARTRHIWNPRPSPPHTVFSRMKAMGKWQKLILAELKQHHGFYVADLLPVPYSRSDYVAILRAAESLHKTGQCNLIHYVTWATDQRRVAVFRSKTELPRNLLTKLQN